MFFVEKVEEIIKEKVESDRFVKFFVVDLFMVYFCVEYVGRGMLVER